MKHMYLLIIELLKKLEMNQTKLWKIIHIKFWKNRIKEMKNEITKSYLKVFFFLFFINNSLYISKDI